MPFWYELTRSQFIKASQETEVAVLITGALEAHGKHLALGTDTILPEFLGKKIAERTKALVLPPIPFGDSWVFNDYDGTVSISPITLIHVYSDIMKGIFKHGFRYIVALNGHGGNASQLEQAAKDATMKGERVVVIVNWWKDLAEEVRRKVLETPDGHGGEDETSVMMYVAPRLVNPALTKSSKIRARFRVVSASYRDELIPDAISGDPTSANAEKGRAIMEQAADELVQLIEQLEKGQLPIDRN